MVATLLLTSSLVIMIISHLAAAAAAPTSGAFIYHGFSGADLSLNGMAAVDPGGLLRLTNNTRQSMGHAFFPTPFSIAGRSFSTAFVFAILSQYPDVSAHGLAFALSPSKDLVGALPSQHLGLFDATDSGNSSDHIVAVELDTVQNLEYNDIDDNHVGIDINDLRSVDSAPASYFTDTSAGAAAGFKNLSLFGRRPLQLWVEYDGEATRLDVTLSPVGVAKPPVPLLSSTINLSSFLADETYVGFSAATGAVTALHYVLGWSFSLGGRAEDIDVSKLPSLPLAEGAAMKQRHLLHVALPTALLILILVVIVLVLMTARKMKYAEEREDWELEYGPHRISYKDLYRATNGFADENLLGAGGFGRVYRGVLTESKLEVAVKRVSNESRQGVKEFVAEIESIGRVRHRNLVQLLGYSRWRGELLLVYDYMPNGSLDKYLHDRPEVPLGWSQRFRIIKGIAAGLLYLHEEWEQVVLHRDIKASNVLLDREFSGRLGDFGLARLYDRGSNAQITHVVGTLGYLAPELSRTRIATTSSDVYAFGAFLLEVACGRRPVELKTSGVELVLVDWVLDLLKEGAVAEARDRRMGDDVAVEEVELVLKLGLLCSHPVPMSRPSMRQAVQFLSGDAPLPADILDNDMHLFGSVMRNTDAFVDSTISRPMEGSGLSAYQFTISETLFSSGR
ncbi:L-type lectin-domain containing receptor kinase IV.1-like [Iris pallida]|uniref:non-specific serine/threonine protein kinase n=1 Tax=Iris pallida TaxID=29817 RepID=A0AAX6IEX5_IRIPA|nr:L-type lectin-domain containing receptor kinase IV.1-like [Iris pallida]